MKFDFSSIESYVSNHLRLFIFSVLGLLILLVIIAISVFFAAVNGEEQTMVPDVRGKELTDALLELQIRELYPRIHLRHSQSPLDRGLILEQDPYPGTIVRAGRRIRLVVSQGIVINRLENFIGRNVDDVRMDFLALYLTPAGQPLFSILEPMMFEFSPEPPGTILEQKPEAGADISGHTEIEFIVSRGRENATIIVPELADMELSQALEVISETGINFSFSMRAANMAESAETVVNQYPAANIEVPLNTVVQLTVTQPDDLAENETFGLFRYTMPANPFPLTVGLDVQSPTGERRRVFTAGFGGGEFTFPYKVPSGSTLILTMLNRELHRETVR